MNFSTGLLYVSFFFSLFTASFFLLTLLENRRRIGTPKARRFPSVTIAIPAFNEENTLARTVESLLALDYPKDKLDIYVVNDGSSDRTLEIARSYESRGVIVIDKKNSGKADSINKVLEVCDTEVFGVLDSDSFAHPKSLRRMVGYFNDSKTVAVTPSMLVENTDNILLKIQYIEYLMGVFLRKVFACLGSVHVTPGPLSLFRKSFFDEYGGYALHNLTEDIEVALRIQSLGYHIDHCVDGYVTTMAPSKFMPLLRQRLRWYKGFIENIWNYRHLFSPRHGNLSILVLPSALFSVVLVIVTMLHMLYKVITDGIIQNYINLRGIDFQFWELIQLRFDFFYLNTTSPMLLGLVALVLGIAVIMLAARMAQIQRRAIIVPYLFFMVGYWFLFGIWWIYAGCSLLVGKKVKWGDTHYE